MFRASVCLSSGVLGCVRFILLDMVFSASTDSSERNLYYVAPEPNTTYSITLTNNYTTQ